MTDIIVTSLVFGVISYLMLEFIFKQQQSMKMALSMTVVFIALQLAKHFIF